MRANNVLPNKANLDQRLEAAAVHFDPFSDGFAAVDLVVDLADEVFDTDCDRCGEHDDDPTYSDRCCWPGDPQDSEECDTDNCPAGDDMGLPKIAKVAGPVPEPPRYHPPARLAFVGFSKDAAR
jgi:hypothetical protein